MSSFKKVNNFFHLVAVALIEVWHTFISQITLRGKHTNWLTPQRIQKSQSSYHQTSRKSHCNNVLSYVSKIQIKPSFLKTTTKETACRAFLTCTALTAFLDVSTKPFVMVPMKPGCEEEVPFAKADFSVSLTSENGWESLKLLAQVEIPEAYSFEESKLWKSKWTTKNGARARGFRFLEEECTINQSEMIKSPSDIHYFAWNFNSLR